MMVMMMNKTINDLPLAGQIGTGVVAGNLFVGLEAAGPGAGLRQQRGRQLDQLGRRSSTDRRDQTNQSLFYSWIHLVLPSCCTSSRGVRLYALRCVEVEIEVRVAVEL